MSCCPGGCGSVGSGMNGGRLQKSGRGTLALSVHRYPRPLSSSTAVCPVDRVLPSMRFSPRQAWRDLAS